MRILSLALVVTLGLAACSSEDAGSQAEQSAPKASAKADASAGEAGAVATAERATGAAKGTAWNYKQQNDLYEFEYSFPAVAPKLAAILKSEAESAETQLKADTREARASAKDSDFPYRPYDLMYEWQQVADIPGFQSLSATIYSFTGGAHGYTGYDALVWDKAAGKELKPIDFFTSSAALGSQIRPTYCKKLDAERRKKREGDLGATGDMFSDCIDPIEQTLLLGSSNGKTFNRLGIIAGPYAAGPYAEGSYEVTLPVTPAILDQVKPEYRSSFSVMR